MNNRDSNVLQKLLGEVAPAQFFADIWQQRPLHCQGNPARFAGLFDRSNLSEAAKSCDSLKAYTRDAHGFARESAVTPERVDEAFRAGATICIGGINGHAPLDEFIARLAAEIVQAGDMSFNCYFSPDGQGFALHCDDHPVWILQLEGRKKWRFSATPLKNPLTTVTFQKDQRVASVPWSEPIARPDEDLFLEALLEPGDLLYLPEGTWHHAAADGASLALTLACNRVSPLDLVQQALGPFIGGHPGLRQNLGGLWRNDVDAHAIPPQFEPLFNNALLELRGMVGKLTAQDLYQAWLALATKDNGAKK
jgi:ribosomal protein L16 Arg81 hydroxylase